MTTHQQKTTLEKLLFLSALLVAGLLRFTNLGQSALTDREASLALQSLQISHGQIPTLLHQPLLILFNSLLFFLFQSSNFFARFLPALCGVLLILSLYWLEPYIPRTVTLILAFALAIDPGLVSISRQVDSSIIVLTSLSFFTVFWVRQKFWASGIMLGISLLNGTASIFAVVILGLALLISLGFEKQIQVLHPDHPLFGKIRPDSHGILSFLGALVLTIILVGTGFFWVAQGLSAAVGGIIDFFRGWVINSDLPASWMLLTLAIYHPIAVIFAGIALLRTFLAKDDQNQANGFQRFLSIWFIAALGVVLLYPHRQMNDLIWAIIPLWIIAAFELQYLFFPLEPPAYIPLLHGGAIFIFFILFGLQIAAYSLVFPYNHLDWIRLATIISTLILIGLVTWLVYIGWAKRAAYQGLALGWIFAMLIYTLASTVGVAFSLPQSQTFRQELWKPYPQIGDADLVSKTIHDLARWNTGNEHNLAITIAVNSPALQWLLHTQQTLQTLPEENALTIFNTQELPHPQVLMSRMIAANPPGTIAYRGQDFNWWIPAPWASSSLPNPLDWLLYRRAAWQPEKIILWARSDLFPGGTDQSTTLIQPALDTSLENPQGNP
ncbi:MAG: hypothetical protein ACPL3P_07060 [Anaerolineales bacterium]